MASIDLKDTYFSVIMAQQVRKLLRFSWQGQIYEFQCLPFGLSSAPRVFTKLMNPVTVLLHQRGLLYLGRHVADDSIKGRVKVVHEVTSTTPAAVRVQHQLGKICSLPYTEDSVPRVYGKFMG